MSSEALTTVLFLAVVLITVGITFWASRQTTARPTTTPAAARSAASRTAWRSPATTCRPRRSSASPAPSRSTATTASSTPSASWSPGWSRCCSSPSCCATPAAYTMADQLAYRMRQRPVRTAAATSTVVVSIFYLLAQMVGAGALVALLLGVDQRGRQGLTIVGVGLLMIFYVTVGGMKGTTWVQIVKAVLLMTRHHPDHRPGAGEVRLQPLRAARRGRGEHRQGRGVPRARPAVRR